MPSDEFIKEQHIISISPTPITIIQSTNEVKIAKDEPVFTIWDIKVEQPRSDDRSVGINTRAIDVD